MGLIQYSLAASGEHQGYYGCRFLGYQDTLYARAGIQYYSNCYIEGASLPHTPVPTSHAPLHNTSTDHPPPQAQ
jgi:hypothetical protein